MSSNALGAGTHSMIASGYVTTIVHCVAAFPLCMLMVNWLSVSVLCIANASSTPCRLRFDTGKNSTFAPVSSGRLMVFRSLYIYCASSALSITTSTDCPILRWMAASSILRAEAYKPLSNRCFPLLLLSSLHPLSTSGCIAISSSNSSICIFFSLWVRMPNRYNS